MEHKHKHKEHKEHKHEHKHHGEMMDNRKVNDNHQEGIKRVLQKAHNPLDHEGHFGGMKGGWNHGWAEDHHKDGKHKAPHHSRKA